MQHTPDTFVEALGSGDADRVNAAIDEANDMDAEEQLRIFEECFDACTALYRDEDGYQRQSIVRFLHELHPPGWSYDRSGRPKAKTPSLVT